ncbi:SDR family oxidoreductase [Paenibacillus brasilensis]|uniref:NADP-dependent 3-hydroxy acid dehydrogenase YdfG n=1 Tax=Paenibacillus brasilensis TaxID=128574 RepID=A0ABU0L7D6_9BACL|nr:SDR family oxidoreductase [Paenibacillus brasilensis]MDQ0497218.1 NADP-dependent 3-hydroxy acid dehydrogenase YdfG [Paenibacillus brasilensis]
MENLQSKVIIITGASSGIGEATAKLLATSGAKVVLAARREDKLRLLTDEIRGAGGEAVFQKADVTSREDMQNLAQLAMETYGRIDVLVNNAGIMPNSRLNELKVDEWDRMIDVNVKGVLYAIAAVLPIMQTQKSGHVINVSSISGHIIVPTTAVYSATKFAVRAISEGLRQEESPEFGIRSTIISPGVVKTELLNSVTSPEVIGMSDWIRSLSISPDRIAHAIAYAINEPDDTSINEMIIRPTIQSS